METTVDYRLGLGSEARWPILGAFKGFRVWGLRLRYHTWCL